MDENNELPPAVRTLPSDIHTLTASFEALIDAIITPLPDEDDSDAYKWYSVEPIPGMGLGLIAVTDIPKGTLIVSEEAVLILNIEEGRFRNSINIMKAFEDMEIPQMQEVYKLGYAEGIRQDIEDGYVEMIRNGRTTDPTAFRQLQAWVLHFSEREARESLLEVHDKILVSNLIFLSNCKRLPPINGVHRSGLFLETARINHSCLPNANSTWDADNQHIATYATKDIKKGEEITIRYYPDDVVLQPASERQLYMNKTLRFNCECSECRKTGLELRRSDLTRTTTGALLARYDNTIATTADYAERQKVIRDILRAKSHMEELDQVQLGHLGMTLSKIYEHHGDFARAREEAEQAYLIFVACFGSTHYITARARFLLSAM